jgi:diphosphomevalonate decarboxylase
LTFLFEGKENPAFKTKIDKYLYPLKDNLHYIENTSFIVSSENTFPHSSGIASSASAMSALALCLCDIEQKILGKTNKDFLKKSSYYARIGSGSACRSVFPSIGIWGKHSKIPKSSNEFAIPYLDVAPTFLNFHDDICIVSKKEKSVSSRAGHALMDGNIYAKNRYTQANTRVLDIMAAMKSGDLEKFGQIVEDEALTLHALMMASTPSFILMEANTLLMINAIRRFRNESKLPIYFTLDAGPNIHLLYPNEIYNKVQDFITDELMPLTEQNTIIRDRVGQGSIKLL